MDQCSELRGTDELTALPEDHSRISGRPCDNHPALAAVEIVELVLPTGRNGEIEPLAEAMTRVFANAGQEHAMHTWLQVRQFAMYGRLTPSDVQGLRGYFQRFML